MIENLASFHIVVFDRAIGHSCEMSMRDEHSKIQTPEHRQTEKQDTLPCFCYQVQVEIRKKS